MRRASEPFKSLMKASAEGSDFEGRFAFKRVYRLPNGGFSDRSPNPCQKRGAPQLAASCSCAAGGALAILTAAQNQTVARPSLHAPTCRPKILGTGPFPWSLVP